MDKNVNNSKSNKIRSRISTVLDVFLVVLGVVALAISGVLIYQKTYLTPFFVNGQSMYPTLNKETLTDKGLPAGKDGHSSTAGYTYIDYGVMDCHKKALDKIQRFDIVVTYYSDSDVSKKIKRVIGLPGETIKFSIGENNGDLYVKNGDDYTYVPQPIDTNVIRAATNYPHREITLKDNEYYVLGDNRYNGCSNDSRDIGPIKYDWLVGRVVAIVGYCELATKDDGSNEPVNIKYFKWPRFMR